MEEEEIEVKRSFANMIVVMAREKMIQVECVRCFKFNNLNNPVV